MLAEIKQFDLWSHLIYFVYFRLQDLKLCQTRVFKVENKLWDYFRVFITIRDKKIITVYGVDRTLRPGISSLIHRAL